MKQKSKLTLSLATDPGVVLTALFNPSEIGSILTPFGASLVAQTVKNLPAMQETWVLSLGQEDLLEEGVATLSSILAWRIPRREEPRRLQPLWSQ